MKDKPARHRHHIESAIVGAALNHVTETDRLVPFGGRAISVWNSHADLIDEKFGKGFLGVRVARQNAFSFRWQIDNETPGKAGVPIGIWLALGKLDDLANYPLLFWEARQANPGIFD
jgi:hypothetical protein